MPEELKREEGWIITHTTAEQDKIDKSIPNQYSEWWKMERLKRVAEHQRNLEIYARDQKKSN